MANYSLTPRDIDYGVERVLAQAYAKSTVSDSPEIVFITGGPGSGKTSIERFARASFKENGDIPFIVGSDMIAEFHPQYEDALEELPEECYRITRQFVRPATPKIFDGLFSNRICIINENTLDKGQPDIDLARKAKDAGYRIRIAVMATDLFESRLSCYERDSRELKLGKTPRGCSTETQLRMYNSFVTGIKALKEQGLADEIQVFTRGKTITTPPIMVYSSTDPRYSAIPDFEVALNNERMRQRRNLLQEPDLYYQRLHEIEETFRTMSHNEKQKNNTLEQLEVLRRDFSSEIDKNNMTIMPKKNEETDVGER